MARAWQASWNGTVRSAARAVRLRPCQAPGTCLASSSAPARGYAIHEAIMNDAGLALVARMMSVAAGPGGVPVTRLAPAPALSCQPVCPGKR
jgi:hypothetical protein